MALSLGCIQTGEKGSGGADYVLYEKYSGWGPCMADHGCWQKTVLYNSGKLSMEGEKNLTASLDAKTMDDIRDVIKTSGIMDKECKAGVVMDYGASYNITDGGRVKQIDFPGCEEDLNKIDELIDQ